MQQAQLVDGEVARVIVKALMGARQSGENEEGLDIRLDGLPAGGIGHVERLVRNACEGAGGLDVVSEDRMALGQEMGRQMPAQISVGAHHCTLIFFRVHSAYSYCIRYRKIVKEAGAGVKSRPSNAGLAISAFGDNFTNPLDVRLRQAGIERQA
jgi:hypothetical protein